MNPAAKKEAGRAPERWSVLQCTRRGGRCPDETVGGDTRCVLPGRAGALPQTQGKTRTPDLGVRTRLQLDSVFHRLPNTSIHGIDISSAMPFKLDDRSRAAGWKLSLEFGSSVELGLGTGQYDAVLFTMTSSSAARKAAPASSKDPSGIRSARNVRERNLSWVARRVGEDRCAVDGVDAEDPIRRSGTSYVDLPLCLEQEVVVLNAGGLADTTTAFETKRSAVIAARRPAGLREKRIAQEGERQ